MDIRTSLLQHAKNLRRTELFKDIYVRPDLTSTEIAQNKIIVADLKERRSAGEDVVIRSGKVVIWSFNGFVHSAPRRH